MARLTDDIKALIVTQLAQFRTYADVARLVTEETGVAVDRFQARTYDPTNPSYAGGDKWRAIFDRVREQYLTSVEIVPIANKAFRLNELQRNYTEARSKGNLALANATLEQAAKEVSLVPHERNGTGRPYENPYGGLTPEERRQMVADMLRSALEAKRLSANTFAII